MKILNKIIKWWKRRHFNLRQACVDKYGEKFGEKYDSLCEGRPIGGLLETIEFIEKVEEVKKKKMASNITISNNYVRTSL